MEKKETVSGKEILKEMLKLKTSTKFIKYFLKNKLDTLDFPKELYIKVTTDEEKKWWENFFDNTKLFKNVSLAQSHTYGESLISWEFEINQERNLLFVRKTKGTKLVETEKYFDDEGNVICELSLDEQLPQEPEINKLNSHK